MAKSRIHKIGSIFERVSGLLETGVLNEKDKPIWFDVYKHHPPKYNPRFDRPTLNIEIKPIFYEEDVLRAKIHKVNKEVFDLNDNCKKGTTMHCQEMMEKGVTLHDAINSLKKETPAPRNKQESTIFQDLKESYHEDNDNEKIY